MPPPPGHPATLRRAFLTVLALRYVPTGLYIPVTSLLMLDRGLTLTDIGVAVAAMGAVVLLLEVPTGGLADVIGARPVLLASGVVALGGVTLMLVADTLGEFLAAYALMGVYRALDSGPLEAWYIDAALAADPDRDLESDLSRAGVVTYLALALGAAGTAITALLPPLGGSFAATATAACLVLHGVHLVGIAVLVREDRGLRPAGGESPRLGAIRARRPLRAMAAATRQSGIAIRAGVRTAWRSRPLRLVLLVELGWASGMSGVELLWQPRAIAEFPGVAPTLITGLISAAGLVLGAAAAATLPPLLRLLGGRLALTAALLLTAQAGVTLLLGWAGMAGILIGYLGFYLLHGPLNAAHAALLARRTPSGMRATVSSLNSLCARVASLPAGVVLGVVGGMSLGWGLTLAAVALLVAAPLYLLSGERHDTPVAVS